MGGGAFSKALGAEQGRQTHQFTRLRGEVSPWPRGSGAHAPLARAGSSFHAQRQTTKEGMCKMTDCSEGCANQRGWGEDGA